MRGRPGRPAVRAVRMSAIRTVRLRPISVHSKQISQFFAFLFKNRTNPTHKFELRDYSTLKRSTIELISFVRFLDCHPTQHLVNFFHGWTRTQDTDRARQYSMEIWTGTFSQIMDIRFLSGQTLTSGTQCNGVFRRHLIYSLPKPKLIFNYNFNH